MEQLKVLSELVDPDPRYASMVVHDYADESFRPYTVGDHYRRYAGLEISVAAPADVRSSFITAQHLAIFSWFVYAMTPLAILQGMSTLELALRTRMNDAPARGLKERLRFAVKQGWLRGDELLPSARLGTPGFGPLAAIAEEEPAAIAYLEMLCDSMPDFRNSLAHGEFMLLTDALVPLDLVVRMINQLYPMLPDA